MGVFSCTLNYSVPRPGFHAREGIGVLERRSEGEIWSQVLQRGCAELGGFEVSPKNPESAICRVMSNTLKLATSFDTLLMIFGSRNPAPFA